MMHAAKFGVVSIDLFLLSKSCFSSNGVYKCPLLLSICEVIDNCTSGSAPFPLYKDFPAEALKMCVGGGERMSLASGGEGIV